VANTYTQIFIHVVFAVKARQHIIPNDKKDELYKYITGIIKNKGHKLIMINGMSDHIHILISFHPDESLSALIKEIKRMSSIFINQNNWYNIKFEWQRGFGAFSYSKSQITDVCKYIQNQEIHHKTRTFREEYMEFLNKFDVEYDEKYIFDDI
jgi:REP element-mobilizing transposase RayT